MRQVLEKIERRKDDTEERMARYDEMGRQLQTLQATASSPDRSVTVTAGSGGGVQSVELRPEALRMGNQQLGRVITATIQQAAASAAKQQAAVVQEFTGDRLNVVGRVFKTQEQVFGTAADAPEQSAPPNRSQRRPESDFGEDEGFGSIFDRRPR
jgi:DNA-binding protein YbaB